VAYQSEIELRVKVADKELRELERRTEQLVNRFASGVNPFGASGGRKLTADQRREEANVQRQRLNFIKDAVEAEDRLRNTKAQKTLKTNLRRIRFLRDQRIKADREVVRSRESMALGAGFPLLMGGGPAQVTGALIGSQVGPGFGGQILGAAIAQQLQDAVARVADLQAAINELNMDKVRDSVLLVNQELSNQVALLKESGQKTQAQAVLAQAVYEQFGLGAEASSLIKERADAIKNAWDRVVGTVSALLALLAQPFIALLVPILNTVQLIVKGWTEIFNLIAKVTNLPGLDKFLGLQGTDEAAGARGAEMQARARAIEKETELLQEALKLEKQRRTGSSFDDKLANVKIDAQLKLNELQAKYRDDLRQTEGEERKALREKLEIEEQILKTKYGQQVARMKAEEAENRATAQIKARSMLENASIQLAEKKMNIEKSIASAMASAFLAVNSLEMQRARNNNDTAKQLQLQIQRADIIYKQTVLQVKQEQKKAKLAVLAAKVKLKELEANVALKKAKGEANAEDFAAIELQKQALDLTLEGVKASKLIARFTLQGAAAIRQASVEQAKFNATQRAGAAGAAGTTGSAGRVGAGRGVSIVGSGPQAGLAQALAQRGVTGTFSVGQAQARLSAIREKQKQQYLASQSGRLVTGIDLARQGFAEGGYVTRPTNAVIGEAGESEYVIPASKMNRAMQRYSAGVRGEAVTAGAVGAGSTTNANYSSQQNMYYGGGGASVNITTGPVIRMDNRDYVTMADMQRGMAAAANAGQANIMRQMQRSYTARRSMGL
jgi:hypothetical protein|tara:strand:- start:8085 stop:10436 length:2352 start_codon:yes stop_codon:yes gene_type:complete